nr:MAG: RNA-dependent RNA polymerase [Porcine picobirnavirus]
MRIEYLTPRETELLDPTGKATAHYQAMHAFEQPSRGYTTLKTDDIPKFIRSKAIGGRHSDYDQMNEEALLKIGPQGNVISYEDLIDIVKLYYDIPVISRLKHPVLQAGRDYLLKLIKEHVDIYGLPQYDYTISYENTSASLPTMSKKGTFMAETVMCKTWRHPIPILAGQRYMRGSPRAIFMDPVANVRYIEGTIRTVKDFLRKVFPQFFSGWLNPYEAISPAATFFVDRQAAFIETDYVKMDRHFTLDIVEEYIFPVYELLVPDTYISFASFVEELFEQPVYLGWGKLLTGRHTLFSGQVITNDFETIYTIELALGILLKYGLLHKSLILANGDDLSIGLLNCTIDRAKALAAELIDISNQLGLIMHAVDDPKTNIRKGKFAFCRKLYYPSGRRNAEGHLLGAYPSVFVMNNIINPEFPCRLPSQAAVADLQRLDGLIGSIDYYQVADQILKHSTHKFASFDVDDIAYVNSRDWWQKLYNERWSPESSPTYRYFAKMRQASN